MKLKKIIRALGSWFCISFITFLLWIITSLLSSFLFKIETSPPSESTSRVMLAMLAVSSINTAVLFYLILRSRWHGIQLILMVALEVFVVQYFLGEIEVIFFNASVNMSLRTVYSQMVGGVFFAVLFAVAAVFISGKLKKPEEVSEVPNTRLRMPKSEFALKFSLLSLVIYPLLYFLFGYFVAWQFPLIRQFYSGSTAILPFFEHFRTTLTANPVLPLWQMARGIIWVLIALPVIRMMKGRAWEAGVAVGLLFSLVMNSVHLMPNPYMPPAVRLGHFIETASSNFIWGMLIVWLMHRKHTSLSDLIKRQSKLN
jgi:hypothetical protein